MSHEEPSIIRKINLSSEQKDIVSDELQAIENILQAIEGGDEESHYADTGGSLEILDSILGAESAYDEILPLRAEASRKIISGDTEKISEGINEIRAWMEKIKEFL
ncbi:hypothetical protein K8R42_04895 [bacterium]|nr:hypothetical protein [bacterium]